MLLSKKLCSARDLRRCASRVRHLTFDLPGFDSVWLDALVQRRVLTSFQARSIEAVDHDRLKIGPSIVLDRIGHGPDSETFLTRLPGERATCVVKRVRIPSELCGPTMKRLQRLIERGRGCQHPGVVIPRACRELPADSVRPDGTRAGRNTRMATQTRLAIVSRPVEGLTLGQMLLRRGRLPERSVVEIARQLLDIVGTLHECKIVHGEIRLGNLLLSAAGQLVLVDSGIRLAICPAFEISAFVEPERNDGIAPELIGTGDPPTAASDLYAIGCVLWQLLAGRPPHPTGDPLAKLAAHQTERIPDVRELAPETPTRLAEAITWLTEPDPANRPAHAREVLAGPGTPRAGISRPALGQPGRRARKVLARFAGQFHHPVARSTAPTQRTRTTSRLAMASAAVLLALASLHLFAGRETVPASIDRFGEWLTSQYAAVTSASADVEGSAQTDDTAFSGVPDATVPVLQSIPEPTAGGVIEFPDAGPWRASSIVWAGGRLTLKGPPGDPARIIVTGKPWQLRATELHLENVEIIPQSLDGPLDFPTAPSDSQPAPAPAMVCQSQSLHMTGCVTKWAFSVGAPEDYDGSEPVSSDVSGISHQAFLRWEALDPSDPLSGDLSFVNCQFSGGISSIELAGPVRQVRCSNTLKLAGGPLFIVGPDAEPVSRTFELERVTVRDSSGLIALRLPEGPAVRQSRITVHSTNCVFSVRGWSSQSGSLITYIGQRLAHDWHRYLTFDGRDSVVAPTTSLASLQTPDAMQRQVLDDSRIQLHGLISTPITFHGTPSFDPTDSVVASTEANRRSSDPPGISVDD